MSQDLEKEPIPRQRRGHALGQAAFSAWVEASNRRYNRKMVADCLREAKEYEKHASQYTDAEPVERGKTLLATGQAYLNDRKVNEALLNFEEAEPYLETYKSQGTLDSFSTLASLYQGLGAAYEQSGQTDRLEETQTKAIALSAELEEHFGIRTVFYPDGSRLTQPVDMLPPITAKPVIA